MRVLLFVCIVISCSVTSYATDFWEILNRPDKGAVRDVAHKDGLWLAGTAGVYFTDDIDGEWAYVSTIIYQNVEFDMGFHRFFAGCFAIIDNNNWYAVAGEGILCKTENKGELWQICENAPERVSGFVQDDNGLFYIAAEGNCYVSADTFKTFTEIEELANIEWYSTRFSILSDETVCITGSCSLYLKRPGSETFAKYEFNEIEDAWFEAVGIIDDKIVLATSENGIYSLDEENGEFSLFIEYPDYDEYSNYNVWISPDGIIWLNYDEVELAVSYDKGQTWIDMSTNTEGRINNIRFIDGQTIVCANGLFISENDGETWARKNKGINIGELYSGVIDSEYAYYVFEHSLFRCHLASGEVEELNTENFTIDNYFSYNFFDTDINDNLWYYSYANDMLMFSSDHGNTWDDYSEKIENLFGLFISKTGDIYAKQDILSNELLKSTDGGDTWDKLDLPAISPIVSCIPDRNGEVIAETIQSMYYSSDRGDTWVKFGKKPPLEDITGISSFVRIDNTFYIPNDYEGLLYTTNMGSNWEELNATLVTEYETYVPSGSKLLNVNGKIYSSFQGIISLRPGDLEWANENMEIPMTRTTWWDMGPNGHIYMINMKGMYRSADPITSVDEKGAFTSAGFAGKVYPNPVGDICHIELKSASGPVTTSVFDISGRVVLNPKLWQAGTNQIDLDMKGQPAGQYFLRIVSSGQSTALIINKK